MSFNLSGFDQKLFQSNNAGALLSKRIGLCGPSKQPPSVVKILIDWSIYGANAAVAVNLIGQTVQYPLDVIRGIAVDNYNSPNPLAIIFPDTGYTVQVDPNNFAQGEVLTNNLQLTVANLSLLANGVKTTTGQTAIYLSNVELRPFDHQENTSGLATPVISEGAFSINSSGNEIYNAFALGNNFFESVFSLTSSGLIGTLISPSPNVTHYVITSIDAFLSEASCGQNTFLNYDIQLVSLGGLLVYDDWTGTLLPSITPAFYGVSLCKKTGLQFYIQGNQTLQINNVSAMTTGQLKVSINYSPVTW